VSTEAVFAADGERLSLRHDAGESAAPYIGGTLIAIRAVPARVGLTRDLDQLLDWTRGQSTWSSALRE
jgi:4-hydroxy-tetrahydrodipicolinate reductase